MYIYDVSEAGFASVIRSKLGEGFILSLGPLEIASLYRVYFSLTKPFTT
jgi:hypothetical protein